MAKNLVIRGTGYAAVPQVNIPLQDGSGNAVFYDTSDADTSAAEVPTGKVFYNANGRGVGSKVDVVVSQDQSTKVLTIS